MTEITSNIEFANRLIKLASDFDRYDFLDNDGDDEEIIEANVDRIIKDLTSHNDTWIRNWLDDVKSELDNRLLVEDPDYLGCYLVECNSLLEYLNK